VVSKHARMGQSEQGRRSPRAGTVWPRSREARDEETLRGRESPPRESETITCTSFIASVPLACRPETGRATSFALPSGLREDVGARRLAAQTVSSHRDSRPERDAGITPFGMTD